MIVKPKEAVLDPQGNAVRDAMRHLGMPEVQSVRIGKYMEINLDGKDVGLEKRLRGLCRDLLSNPVIEDYELQKSDINGQRSEPARAGAVRVGGNAARAAGASAGARVTKSAARKKKK